MCLEHNTSHFEHLEVLGADIGYILISEHNTSHFEQNPYLRAQMCSSITFYTYIYHTFGGHEPKPSCIQTSKSMIDIRSTREYLHREHKCAQ